MGLTLLQHFFLSYQVFEVSGNKVDDDDDYDDDEDNEMSERDVDRLLALYSRE